MVCREEGKHSGPKDVGKRRKGGMLNGVKQSGNIGLHKREQQNATANTNT